MTLPHHPFLRLTVLFVACIFGLIVQIGAAQAANLVGGPCRYDDFPGQATIVAVSPQPADAAMDPSRPGLAVTFTFAPDQPIADPLFVPGKVYHLTLVSGQTPGARFVARYGIKPGRALPCRMRLIRQGTCTPVLFDFPGIDLTKDLDLPKNRP